MSFEFSNINFLILLNLVELIFSASNGYNPRDAFIILNFLERSNVEILDS